MSAGQALAQAPGAGLGNAGLTATRRRTWRHTTPLLPALLLTLMLASGCARFGGVTQTTAPGESNDHRAQVLAVQQWQLHGRLAMQRGDTGFSGNLDWQQQRGAYELRVTAPLNGGIFALSGDHQRVSLLTPKGEVYQAISAEHLMQRHLGWTIPVSGAQYWVRGVPAPSTPASQPVFDQQGRWTDFAQQGWRVSVLDYFDELQPALPRKLFFSRDDLKVRIVIKRWGPG